MVALKSDCLVFVTRDGNGIPCEAEVTKIELVGHGEIDPEIVKEAAASVIYYYRHELGRDMISVEEFSFALTKVLKRLGVEVEEAHLEDEPKAPRPPRKRKAATYWQPKWFRLKKVHKNPFLNCLQVPP
jgi:hypothetical protein